MTTARIRRTTLAATLVAALVATILPVGTAQAAGPPVGDWKANEGSGTSLVDASGLANNGTITGNPTWVAGQHGQAIRFDGNDYATVTDNATLDITSAITMAAWVKPEVVGTQNLIKKATNGGANGYELSLSTAQKVFVRFNQATSGDTIRLNSTTPYPTNGTWMHVAATWDGATIRLYVNGVEEANMASTTAIATNALDLRIGAQPDGQFPLTGTMDDVLLYNSALTPSEIAALASIAPPSTPPNGPTLSAPTNGATGLGTTPTLDVIASDPDSSSLTVTFYGRPFASGVFQVVGSASGVASGAHATTPWAAIGAGQKYEWYATVSDGATTTTGPTWTFSTAAGADPVFVGAGDAGSCTSPGDEATAAIVAAIEGTVFTTGDNAYPDGTAADFTNCYDPTWGVVKSRTRPIPGNHDWNTANLAGYVGYFGAAATDAGGKSYYSYNIAGSNWHVVNLDSECAKVPGGCGVGSPQELWLRADLAANASKNVIALWHKPRFSSGATNLVDVQPFVDALYEYGADIALVGHDHVYERQVPLNPAGQADPTYGINMFTVGTGGESHHSIGTVRSTSQVLNNDTYGVMKFTLHANSYDWRFFPEAGKTFTDSGTAVVHGAPGSTPSAFTTIPVTDTTGEKPQSKIWQNAGTSWAVLPSTAVSPAGTWIWRLNNDDTWSNVFRVSSKTDVQADAKRVGNVTHILLHGPSPELVSVEYVSSGNTYQAWTTRPTATQVALPGSEIATIDIDSTGRMWLATENGSSLDVYYSDAPYSSFAGPVTLANNINGDDIGVVTALPNNTIGVLWSNQNTQRFGFKVHVDGQAAGTWSADEVPASGSALSVGLGMADDHLNVAVASDGTLYAAVKTSYDTAGYPKIALLIRRPNGTWDPLYEVDQSGTRGIVLLNEQDDTVRVVYTSSEGFNDIVMKTSSTSSIAFGPRVTLLTGGVNDVTSTKQNWTGRVPVMASSATTAYTAFITAGASTQTPTNDFNGDGRSDLAWRNSSTGEDYLWFMNGTQLGSSGPTLTLSDQAWKVAGTGDLNGDAKADLVWRNSTTGQVYVWLMDGTTIASSGPVFTLADPDWKLVGTGDFNGNGTDDLLWRNAATGENYIWFMNGTALASSGPTLTLSDTGWKVVGVGDFNGDTKADIAWRNASGQLYVWLMDGTSLASHGAVFTLGDANWKVQGTGDYDGNGRDDLLWRNEVTGENYLWFMNGTTLASSGPIQPLADLNWKVQGTGDYDGNTKADIAWRNASTGQVYVWLMDGTSLVSHGATFTLADPDWQIVPTNPPAGALFRVASSPETGLTYTVSRRAAPRLSAAHPVGWWHKTKATAPRTRPPTAHEMTWTVARG